MANPYDIREIFDAMAMDLIQSQKRTFLRHQGEQLKEGFQWEQWQLAKLRELRKYRQENKDIVGGYRKEINALIDETLTGNFRKGEDNVERAIKKIKQFVIETPEGEIDPELLKKYTPDEIAELRDAENIVEAAARLPQAAGTDTFFSTNDKKLKALQQVVKRDMRKAQYAVLRKMDDVYRQTIYKSQIYMSSGATTLNQAIDMATKDFLSQGINCIQYKDGKMVNVASWAEMSLRTASHRATMLGEGKKQDEWNMHLVVITAHGNTCEMCLPWQGKVLIDDVFSNGKPDGVHTLLSVAIAAGLFHPNCRHSKAIYFEGITELPKQPVDDETALARYNAEQKQRGMERQINKYKRIEAGSLDDENVNKAADKVKEWQGNLRQHLKDNQYLRKTNITAKAVIEKTGNNDILSDRKWLKAPFSTQKKFDKHIEKHLEQYGNITSEKYLNTARDLLSASLNDDIEGFLSKDGFIFKYRKSTNDFAIGRADGKVSTLYKPTKGYDQWLEEIEKFKKEG
ncbi:MAG: phage minor capsid protein [Ruminiclostridium sp.]